MKPGNTEVHLRITRATAALAIFLLIAFLSALCGPAMADGPRDNVPSQVRPIPPLGNDLEPAERQSLQLGVDQLGKEIDSLRQELAGKPALLRYLPDVQIFHNAVRYPLVHHETIEVGMARRALAHGMQRAADLRAGRTPWVNVTGPRGYVSRIDGSVQPYVLSIPAGYKPGEKSAHPWRLDVWGHGRDELLTELRFVEMDDLLHEYKYLNEPTDPKDRFILNLYGRYINAYRFAGETDGLEALDEVGRQYPIDPNRRLIIGFSLGGTAAWQYAVHYPDLWAAAAPAAGFAEARQFLKTFQNEDVSGAPWYQQALWHLYDSTDYAANLFNVPAVAYGGELDPQRQASEMMLEATAAEGVHIERIVGRGIGHHYTPEAKAQLDGRLDEILARGRNPVPDKIRFTTWTLRYNKLAWLTVDALEHHWQRARVEGEILRSESNTVKGFSLRTTNVTALTLSLPSGTTSPPIPAGNGIAVIIDGQAVVGQAANREGAYVGRFVRGPKGWTPSDAAGAAGPSNKLRKRHGLQGPIDDAFMDRFLIVRPTGRPLNARTGAWAAAECEHAIDHWFKQFRGEPRVKNDTDVTDADLAEGNVILFGDPSSNSVLKRLAEKLPIGWTASAVTLGDRTYPADHHVPVLIYPNPLHPDHYVVINS
ncbi:MAG: alpha/beta hydrolase: peptidase or carbohydrate esterase, partial [Phycisphaerales bacterium]|nr:alpha/beta hydrolase: peptidase or carbohydrate esterase [Phycisphaerales bacterium]